MQKDICRKLTGVAIPPSKYDLFLILSQLGPPPSYVLLRFQIIGMRLLEPLYLLPQSSDTYCLNAFFSIYSSRSIFIHTSGYRIQICIALWKSLNKRMQIAQFLRTNFAYIFAQMPVKRISHFPLKIQFFKILQIFLHS